MTFKYDKLKGRIVEIFKTQGAFAKAMGWSEKTLSKKLNNGVTWKQPEILKAMSLLKIPNFELREYFFTHKVQNIEPSATKERSE